MGASTSRLGDHDYLDENSTIIAVVGQTGVGKSTFINCAVSQDVLEVTHPSPTARDIQHVECSFHDSEHVGISQHVVFVEAPGFDSEREEVEITKKLARWLKNASSKKIVISGILYLHRITDHRLTSPPIRHLTLLRTLCEKSIKGFPNRVILVTTMWDHMKDEGTGRRREAELQNYWNTLPTGSIVSDLLRFENTPESAILIVRALLRQPEDRPPRLERKDDDERRANEQRMRAERERQEKDQQMRQETEMREKEEKERREQKEEERKNREEILREERIEREEIENTDFERRRKEESQKTETEMQEEAKQERERDANALPAEDAGKMDEAGGAEKQNKFDKERQEKREASYDEKSVKREVIAIEEEREHRETTETAEEQTDKRPETESRSQAKRRRRIERAKLRRAQEEAEEKAANEAAKRGAQEAAQEEERECADREKRKLFREEQRRKEIEEEEAIEATERAKRQGLRKRAREQQEREEVQNDESERRARAEAAMIRRAQEEAREKKREDIERQERMRVREEQRRKDIKAEEETEAREKKSRAERALIERAKEEAEEEKSRIERMRRWDAERVELQKQEDERRRKMQEDQARRENQEKELMQRWEVERQEGELYRECCDLVSRLAKNPECWTRLTKFRGNDLEAQAMADFLNKILDKNHCHPAERKHVLSFLSRITKSAQNFPKCLELEGVDCDLSSDPVVEGGTGAIFKGRHNGRVVCVKAVQSRKADKQRALRAQVAELTLWAHILHPNIHPFYGIFLSQESTPRICIVSPWVEAGNLSEFLRSTPELESKHRTAFVSTKYAQMNQGLSTRILTNANQLLDIASGLQYLHSLEIVHGDLKANNVLVSQMRAVLSDFGTSQIEKMAPSTTTAQGVSGTLHWMAPELLKANSKPPATCESDMWSFACLAYEVMMDKIPFEEYGTPQLIRAIVVNQVIPTKPSNSDHAILPVWPLLKRCWDYDDGKRPNAEEARAFVAALGVEDTRPPLDDDSIQSSARLQERRKLRSDAVAIDIHCVHGVLRQAEEAHREEKVQKQIAQIEASHDDSPPVGEETEPGLPVGKLVLFIKSLRCLHIA